jgi:hypothetical protein
MSIQERINNCLADTLIMRDEYPAVTNVRYELFDIPYAELVAFAQKERLTIHQDMDKQRVFVIHDPFNLNKQMDTDIWLYSTVVKIKPAEIIAE